MSAQRKIFEATGIISNQKEIKLDLPLPLSTNSRIKISVSLEAKQSEELELLKEATLNPAFKDIFEDSEDIYTLNDGRPFNG